MLWHRQAIFDSKGDMLSSSAECRIRTQRVSETQSPADWMPADKPTELSRIKLKNLNSTARPYDQQAFSLPDPTAIWHSHPALAIYIFVVVNFDALAQARDFRLERRQVVFLCGMQDSNPEGLWNPISSRLNACWQTNWAIEDQAKKLELDGPSLWSANIQPTWPHCHLAFAPGSGDILHTIIIWNIFIQYHHHPHAGAPPMNKSPDCGSSDNFPTCLAESMVRFFFFFVRMFPGIDRGMSGATILSNSHQNLAETLQLLNRLCQCFSSGYHYWQCTVTYSKSWYLWLLFTW